MGVNVAAHTRHIFLGSAPPPPREYPFFLTDTPAANLFIHACKLSRSKTLNNFCVIENSKDIIEKTSLLSPQASEFKLGQIKNEIIPPIL